MNIARERCRNHEHREAACRCPECRGYFCRECVTEHDGRLLCTNCLAALEHPAARRRGRGLLSAAGIALSLLLIWSWCFAAGEAVVGYRPQLDALQGALR